MSIAKLEERREKLIASIHDLPEEKLASVEAFISEINNPDAGSIESIYKKAVNQYHDTLLKLAQ